MAVDVGILIVITQLADVRTLMANNNRAPSTRAGTILANKVWVFLAFANAATLDHLFTSAPIAPALTASATYLYIVMRAEIFTTLITRTILSIRFVTLFT